MPNRPLTGIVDGRRLRHVLARMVEHVVSATDHGYVEVVAEPVRPDLPWPLLLALPVPLTLGEARAALSRASDWQYTIRKVREAVELLAGRRPQLEPWIDRSWKPNDVEPID